MVLQSKRLTLKPVAKSDEVLLHQQFINPVVRKYLWDDELVSLEQTREIINTSEDLFKRASYGLWLICLKPDLLMGFAGLWHFFGESRPQLLFGLLPEYHGQGYATEAADLVVYYAFSKLGLSDLVGSTDAPNEPSKRVMTRLGMTHMKTKVVNGKETWFYHIKK